MQNALKLGGSLVLTLGIGFGVRIALRRFLGPAVIGPVNFADAFSTTAFVFLGLGLETYVRKVVPVTLDGANAFLGAIFVIRAGIALAVFAAMGVVLSWMGQPPEVRTLVYAYGLAQLFITFNQTFVALLQSARTVDGLSTINVISKLLWAAGFVLTMALHLPLVGIPLSVAASEFLKLVVGYFLARKHVKLKLAVDWSMVIPTLRAAFPFYVSAIALVVVNRFDVNVLKVRSVDSEIGLYSAAAELSQMTLVLMPMLAGVVMPLFARAHARGQAEFSAILRRTLEFVLTLIFPMSLMVSVGSDVWVQLALGDQYAPAAWALAILGPTLLLTYTVSVIAVALNVSGGEWTVTITSVMSMFINPALVILLVGFSSDWGPGGGGAACAFAIVGTETVVLAVMTYRLGRSAVDARLVKMIVKTILSCVLVGVIDRQLRGALGPARLLLDAVIYAALVFGTGAISMKDTLGFVKQLRAQRAARTAT